MDHKTNIHELKEKIKDFCEERDWDQFHNAKELAIGIVTEASELLQHFRFKTEQQVDELFKTERKEELKEELADILYFTLRLAQRYKIDLTTELNNKMGKNKEKYPIEKAKGSNKKYTEF
ncbi:nucleotide pyrophosphohydrolase [Candidatus Woesearchaeota archaeon]|nr:nucleotide pyrophosphohydrolase [Candidatus Woesearchaeota archaeon]MBT5111503.1 nucleotide pyrophosphohydrolase [Candidatus Woesearchaeota archaeon]MBT5215105.1 nucleotide pyrophosphohydrolase [Candidatus Woesearchaeota archaeon]MBT6941112.1 nucleotide pyrophosphohydrolase [Candidatus Woesearchaeota archaeon]